MSEPIRVAPVVWEMALVPEYWAQPYISMEDIAKIEPSRWMPMTKGSALAVGNNQLMIPAPNGFQGAMVKYYMSHTLNNNAAYVYNHCGEKHDRLIARVAASQYLTLQRIMEGPDMALVVAVHSSIGMQHVMDISPPWTFTVKQLKAKILSLMLDWTRQTQIVIVEPKDLKNGVTMKGVFGQIVKKKSGQIKPATQIVKRKPGQINKLVKKPAGKNNF